MVKTEMENHGEGYAYQDCSIPTVDFHKSSLRKPDGIHLNVAGSIVMVSLLSKLKLPGNEGRLFAIANPRNEDFYVNDAIRNFRVMREDVRWLLPSLRREIDNSNAAVMSQGAIEAKRAKVDAGSSQQGSGFAVRSGLPFNDENFTVQSQ